MSNSLNINNADFNNTLGAFGTMFGHVSVDEPFKRNDGTNKTYSPTYIRIGLGAPSNTGTLVLEDQEGVVDFIPNVVSGEYIPIAKIRRVLSSATINGTLYTTTCDAITWIGGAR